MHQSSKDSASFKLLRVYQEGLNISEIVFRKVSDEYDSIFLEESRQ